MLAGSSWAKTFLNFRRLKSATAKNPLIRDDATTRYALFREQYHQIENRLPLISHRRISGY